MIDIQKAWEQVRADRDAAIAAEAEANTKLRTHIEDFYNSAFNFVSDSKKKISASRTSSGLTLDAGSRGFLELTITKLGEYRITTFKKSRNSIPTPAPEGIGNYKDEATVCKKIAEWYEDTPMPTP